MKSKNPSISIPEFKKPAIAPFETPYGTGSYNEGKYQFSLSPQEQQTYNEASKIRNDLLKSLGIAQQTPQEDPWTKLLLQESLRTTQPQLENALIGRGLGGSSVYQGALTDLFSKLGTQAILQGRNQRLNELTGLQNIILPQQEYGKNILNLLANTGLQEEQLEMNRYNSILPYLANITMPGNSGLEGLFSGAATGAKLGASGGLPGIIAGAAAGGATGYYGSKTQDQTLPYLYYSMQQKNQQSTKNPLSALNLDSSGGTGGGLYGF